MSGSTTRDWVTYRPEPVDEAPPVDPIAERELSERRHVQFAILRPVAALPGVVFMGGAFMVPVGLLPFSYNWPGPGSTAGIGILTLPWVLLGFGLILYRLVFGRRGELVHGFIQWGQWSQRTTLGRVLVVDVDVIESDAPERQRRIDALFALLAFVPLAVIVTVGSLLSMLVVWPIYLFALVFARIPAWWTTLASRVLDLLDSATYFAFNGKSRPYTLVMEHSRWISGQPMRPRRVGAPRDATDASPVDFQAT